MNKTDKVQVNIRLDPLFRAAVAYNAALENKRVGNFIIAQLKKNPNIQEVLTGMEEKQNKIKTN